VVESVGVPGALCQVHGWSAPGSGGILRFIALLWAALARGGGFGGVAAAAPARRYASGALGLELRCIRGVGPRAAVAAGPT
jgi:hypothetical protein